MALFVHGCFWHGHKCPRGDRRPKTNAEYWRNKIERNVSRDIANVKALQALGWRPEIVWECETRKVEELEIRLKAVVNQK